MVTMVLVMAAPTADAGNDGNRSHSSAATVVGSIIHPYRSLFIIIFTRLLVDMDTPGFFFAGTDDDGFFADDADAEEVAGGRGTLMNLCVIFGRNIQHATALAIRATLGRSYRGSRILRGMGGDCSGAT